MAKYFDMLMEDVRMKEGLQSCMNCGVCTGVCPAAEFYNYDPRQIVCIVQTRDDDAIEELLNLIFGILIRFPDKATNHVVAAGIRPIVFGSSFRIGQQFVTIVQHIPRAIYINISKEITIIPVPNYILAGCQPIIT